MGLPDTIGLMMRVLLITTNFPNAREPTRGIFNYQMACALAVEHDVAVIAHVSWLDAWKWKAKGGRFYVLE